MLCQDASKSRCIHAGVSIIICKRAVRMESVRRRGKRDSFSFYKWVVNESWKSTRLVQTFSVHIFYSLFIFLHRFHTTCTRPLHDFTGTANQFGSIFCSMSSCLLGSNRNLPHCLLALIVILPFPFLVLFGI